MYRSLLHNKTDCCNNQAWCNSTVYHVLSSWSIKIFSNCPETPRFLGGSLLGVMRELRVLTGVAMSGDHDQFCFVIKMSLVIHIFISLMQASKEDIAVSFDNDTHGWKEIYN